MRRYTPIAFALFSLLSAAACTVGEGMTPTEMVNDDLTAGKDPCSNADLQAQINVHADANDPHHFQGTPGDDVIFGTAGDDVIFGGGGDDIICAGAGDDYIDGGGGKDQIFAGAGNDVVHGRGDSDWIYGGDGDDVLFGDLLDDHIFGEAGDDIIIGGHGTDVMDGGAGDDFFRGDTGNDTFTGGGGYDIASFATALPPGQPEIASDGTTNTILGVKVAFPTDPTKQCEQTGCADGDGGNEPLHNIQEYVGSVFSDHFATNGAKVQPGSYGPDFVNGATTGDPTPVSTVLIEAAKDHNGKLVDVGLVVLGSLGNDDITVHGGNGGTVLVTANHALTAVAPCTQDGADAVRCDVDQYIASVPHRPNPFHYILAWGDKGNDTITFDGTFPRDVEVSASGGEGDDHLIGGDEQDIFFTGTDGKDHLEGNGGDDALIGESHHDASWDKGDRPKSANYHDGADIFDGGSGNDQLVVDYVCGGHRYIGGPGRDIAGFARSGYHPIHAQLGGVVQLKTQWWGFAANMDLCGDDKSAWTSWKRGKDADLEVLEASDGADYLWGDDGANTIWGRGGGDHMYGLGGNDTLLGADGHDVIDGGPGHNTISYGEGQ
jgi:Ca2+-binding RTX toxin-like protein